MYTNKTQISIAALTITIISTGILQADFSKEDSAKNTTDFIRSIGLQKEVDSPITVSANEKGFLTITDPGSFFVHYLILKPEKAIQTSIDIDETVKAPPQCNKVLVVTHGWIDKAAKDWPADLAAAVNEKTDPNEWLCCVFDWKKGAAVINPLDSAKYARDIAGPKLAKTLLKLTPNITHLHIVAHSAGSWAADSAAETIAMQTGASIHITFLDAYVPGFWKQSQLGLFKTTSWCDHYYTKDFTLTATDIDLTNAHNVNITDIDPWIKEHEFPYRWYHATVTGQYEHRKNERNQKVFKTIGTVEYGYNRSLESSPENWTQSLKLKKGNKALLLKKTK